MAADKKTRWSTNEKIRIVLYAFNPKTKVAELCREHNLSPRAAYAWKEKFLEGGKDAVARSGTNRRFISKIFCPTLWTR